MNGFGVAVVVAVVVVIALVTALNVAVFLALLLSGALRRPTVVHPKRIEIIARHIFMGQVMEEERIVVDATGDDPVELDLVHDEESRLYL
jgi:hypothetical protein